MGVLVLLSQPRNSFFFVMKLLPPLLALSLFLNGISIVEAGGVAVLDIDEVARQLGVEEKVRVDLASLQKRLNQDLQRTQGQLQSEMNGVQKAAGENPTEKQLTQIRATGQQLNSEFARLKAQAEQTLAQERVRVINEFRIKLEPIARDAAAELGLDVVLMKVMPPVFTFAPEVDITAATVKLAIEAGLKVEPKAATPSPIEVKTEAPAEPAATEAGTE